MKRTELAVGAGIAGTQSCKLAAELVRTLIVCPKERIVHSSQHGPVTTSSLQCLGSMLEGMASLMLGVVLVMCLVQLLSTLVGDCCSGKSRQSNQTHFIRISGM